MCTNTITLECNHDEFHDYFHEYPKPISTVKGTFLEPIPVLFSVAVSLSSAISDYCYPSFINNQTPLRYCINHLMLD